VYIALFRAELEARHGDLRDALSCLDELLENLERAGRHYDIAHATADLVIAFERFGDPTTAATILGTVTEPLANLGFVGSLTETVERLRLNLGSDAFDHHVAVGQAMDRATARSFTRDHLRWVLSDSHTDAE
jgi:hypothetical protein